MVGTRHFNPFNRPGGRIGAAAELMRFEIQKKGKLPASERYKRIMKKKLEENKKQALGAAYKKPFSFSDKIGGAKKMSARTEQALKEIAMKKARKLAREERKMVIVQPRNLTNGRVNAKGEIYDIAGNIVGRINTKNGRICTLSGWSVGRYKPKSYFANMVIEDMINKHSPYFINLRKMQMLQQQGIEAFNVHGPMMNNEVINVHGSMVRVDPNNPYGFTPEEVAAFDSYGTNLQAPRQNVGVTAWGARADNVWGTYADNAWGVGGDNVWGTYNSDVWGGMGAGNLWANSGRRVWGTGSGTNYLKGITSFFAGLFGFSTKKNRENLRKMTAIANAQRNSSGSNAAASGSRASAPAPTARR